MTPAIARTWRRIAAGWLASAALLGIGCHTAGKRAGDPKPAPTAAAHPEAKIKTLSAADGIRSDPAVTRTGFEPTATPEQRIGVHMELGRGHEQQGEFEAALGDYRNALAALDVPDQSRKTARAAPAQKATAHRRMATVLDRLGRFSESEAHYKAAMKLAPDDPKVWNNAGYSQYMQARWEEAEKTLRTAARLAPDDATIATNLGLTLAARGKTDEARKVMTKTIGPAAAHANIGFVLAANGRRAEAVGQYRQALSLQPRMAEAEAALTRLAKEGESAVKTTDLPPLPADPAVRPASAEATAKGRLFGPRP
jgi:Flp pilus assembly protein TadD